MATKAPEDSGGTQPTEKDPASADDQKQSEQVAVSTDQRKKDEEVANSTEPNKKDAEFNKIDQHGDAESTESDSNRKIKQLLAITILQIKGLTGNLVLNHFNDKPKSVLSFFLTLPTDTQKRIKEAARYAKPEKKLLEYLHHFRTTMIENGHNLFDIKEGTDQDFIVLTNEALEEKKKLKLPAPSPVRRPTETTSEMFAVAKLGDTYFENQREYINHIQRFSGGYTYRPHKEKVASLRSAIPTEFSLGDDDMIRLYSYCQSLKEDYECSYTDVDLKYISEMKKKKETQKSNPKSPSKKSSVGEESNTTTANDEEIRITINKFHSPSFKLEEHAALFNQPQMMCIIDLVNSNHRFLRLKRELYKAWPSFLQSEKDPMGSLPLFIGYNTDQISFENPGYLQSVRMADSGLASVSWNIGTTSREWVIFDPSTENVAKLSKIYDANKPAQLQQAADGLNFSASFYESEGVLYSVHCQKPGEIFYVSPGVPHIIYSATGGVSVSHYVMEPSLRQLRAIDRVPYHFTSDMAAILIARWCLSPDGNKLNPLPTTFKEFLVRRITDFKSKLQYFFSEPPFSKLQIEEDVSDVCVGSSAGRTYMQEEGTDTDPSIEVVEVCNECKQTGQVVVECESKDGKSRDVCFYCAHSRIKQQVPKKIYIPHHIYDWAECEKFIGGDDASDFEETFRKKPTKKEVADGKVLFRRDQERFWLLTVPEKGDTSKRNTILQKKLENSSNSKSKEAKKVSFTGKKGVNKAKAESPEDESSEEEGSEEESSESEESNEEDDEEEEEQLKQKKRKQPVRAKSMSPKKKQKD
eukprot:TRINITY_DN24959_c0_g1_i1.p1 TRINITY_DN24959_c0_g1~~TRINITY_DN24959_c0_g1_i1.p1  ORF type:complete len:809 (-),score=136.47 TRINITY_DN24959_c0_g1_i1:53-2479(-)